MDWSIFGKMLMNDKAVNNAKNKSYQRLKDYLEITKKEKRVYWLKNL